MTHAHIHAPLHESLALSSGSWEKFRCTRGDSVSFNLKNVYNPALSDTLCCYNALVFCRQIGTNRDPICSAGLTWFESPITAPPPPTHVHTGICFPQCGCLHLEGCAVMQLCTSENKMYPFCVCTAHTSASLPAKKPGDVRRYGSQLALSSEHDALSLTNHNAHRLR